MKLEYIDRIELLDSGELLLGLKGDGDPSYQYVYREAAGVYWDPKLKGFKSTELKEWTVSMWFAHMVDIVRDGLGVQLQFSDEVSWKKIPDNERANILTGMTR